jgi:putative transposase
MALSKSALSELLDALRAGGDLDVIREGLALVLQALIDAEATQHIGARPSERSEQRTAHRNGARTRAAVDQGRRCRAQDPQAAGGLLLPGAAGVASPHRLGAAGGGHGGLRARHLHPRG